MQYNLCIWQRQEETVQSICTEVHVITACNPQGSYQHTVTIPSCCWRQVPQKHLPVYAVLYSTLFHFWLVGELVELADRGTGCGEMARGGCLFAWNFSVIRSALLMETESKALDQTWDCRFTSDSLLAYHFKILPTKTHALYYTLSHAPSLMETSYLVGQICNHVCESTLSKQPKIFTCPYETFKLVYEYHCCVNLSSHRSNLSWNLSPCFVSVINVCLPCLCHWQ